jgi:lipopolysaccharide transport system ATP-binding protein
MTNTGSNKSVIAFHGASKSYVTVNRPLKNLWHALTSRGGPQVGVPTYTALQPLNLSIQAGEVVGLVGLNGAGKSTLLQLVAKTISPTAGQIEVNGSVGAILELGAGFNPEFTGREKAELAMLIANTPTSEYGRIIEEVISFADIGQFLSLIHI